MSDVSFFVTILHPDIPDEAMASRKALVCERVQDAAGVYVEKFPPFPPMPTVNDVGYTALRRAVESGASHLIFLATDYLPCEDFIRIATKVVTARPDEIISLQASATAKFLKPGWYSSVDGIGACVILPMELVKDYFEFASTCINEFGHCASLDMNFVLYAQSVGATIYHPIPSLVSSSTPGVVPPFKNKADWDNIDWTSQVQMSVGRESGNAHWRLITAMKPEHRKIRLAYALEMVRPALSEDLKKEVEARQLPKTFNAPENMVPFVRMVMQGEYDFQLMPDMKEPTILDLGANVGAFALWAKRRFPGCNVICYEPHPDNAKVLRENIKTFEIPAKVVEVAVTNGTGPEVTLYDGRNNCGEASLTRGIEQAETSHTVKTLSTFDLPMADMLKLDTEGCELPILVGYPHMAKVSVVVLEWHSAKDKVRIAEFLTQQGFELVKDEVHNAERGIMGFRRAN